MVISAELMAVLVAIRDAEGIPFLVGGSVRDHLLNEKNDGPEIVYKDIDIEVYGLNYEQLQAIISPFGWVDIVGASFGVLKAKLKDGLYYDFSLPRTESKMGVGHKQFSVNVNPDMPIKTACSRRDFTFNALMYDPFTGSFTDCFGGIQDLQSGILRHVSESFAEDPLRVLRGMQFCGRFELRSDEATNRLCGELIHEYRFLAKERVWEEWSKWALKSNKPSMGLTFLKQCNWLGLYPELYGLISVPQDEEWHPEGDVFNHTLHVVDYASLLAVKHGLNEEQTLVLVFSALCHDMAKPVCTEMRDVRGKMRWTAYGHEAAGGAFASNFLNSINCPKAIIDKVVPLVKNHMATSLYREGGEGSSKTVRKLAERLVPSNIEMLALLCEADVSGRPPLPQGITVNITRMLEFAEKQFVISGPQSRLIQGKDIIELGVTPGPIVGTLVKEAYQAQLDGEFIEETKIDWLKAKLRSESERA